MAVDTKGGPMPAVRSDEHGNLIGELKVAISGDEQAGFFVDVALPNGDPVESLTTDTKEEAGKEILRVLYSLTG